MGKLTKDKKMEIVKRVLDRECLSGDLGGRTLEISEYLDILVFKSQCRRMGIRGLKDLQLSCNN